MKASIISSRALLVFLSSVLISGCERDTDTDPPSALFFYSSAAAFPVTIQFLNTSTNPVGVSSTYKWHFGDGATATTTDAVHVYTQAGTYNVMLVQTPSTGPADSLVMALSFSREPGPSGSSNRQQHISSANFNYSILSRAYEVVFTNSSVFANSYLWKFGDGTTSTSDSATVTHTYNTGGTYHVNLTVTGSGGTDTTGATIIF